MSREVTKAVPYLTAVLGAVFVAFAPLYVKLAVENEFVHAGNYFAPTASGFWRMFLSLPIIFTVWLVTGGRLS